MGNNIQIFGRTFSDVSSITVNNTSSSAVKYVQEPIFEDITISQDYLVEQNTVVSNGIIFQTDETYPGTPVILNNTNAIGIDNGSLRQRGAGIKIDLNKTYHCTGELKIEWSTGEQEIYSIDSDFILSNYSTDNNLSFSWEGLGTSIQTFYRINFRSSGSSPLGYNFYINAYTASSITKSGVLLDGSYYQISVTSDGFNTINLNLSSDPRFQAIYKSLAYRSVIASSALGVSEWCDSLSSFTTQQFAGQPFSGDFTFNNIKTINYYAFGSVYAGTETGNHSYFGLNFPSCSSIWAAAFVANLYLQSVSFPECTTIGNSAFQNCFSLTTISFPKCITIGSYAFNGCRKLTTISFPECITIGNSAFNGCRKLTTISFPECITIGSYAFSGCSKLTTISFSECTSINIAAFHYCSSLTSAYFPECTFIGGDAFQSCYSLTTISFPKCTSIDYQAFQYCSSLTSAYFPECSILSNNVFKSCSNLTIVSFPKCTSIGAYAFQYCYSLTSAYFMASSIISLGGMTVFASTPMSLSSYLGYYGSIYVPASLLASYKTATNWTIFSSRMVGI